MYKKAFSLAETLIVLIVVGTVGVCVLATSKPRNVEKSVLTKAGSSMLLQINVATTQILAKYSVNYQTTKLLTTAKVQFSIADSGADAKLIALYKKVLGAPRKQGTSSAYTGSILYNESGSKVNGDMKISDFTQGFKTKNGTYFAIKLNGNCTTSETYIYDPSTPDIRTAAKSCGLIFFDVNGEKIPNRVGLDQYIVSIGKMGLK